MRLEGVLSVEGLEGSESRGSDFYQRRGGPETLGRLWELSSCFSLTLLCTISVYFCEREYSVFVWCRTLMVKN